MIHKMNKFCDFEWGTLNCVRDNQQKCITLKVATTKETDYFSKEKPNAEKMQFKMDAHKIREDNGLEEVNQR